MGQAGGEHMPFVFSGSLVVQGNGIARVMNRQPHSDRKNRSGAGQRTTGADTRADRDGQGRQNDRRRQSRVALLLTIFYGISATTG
jgi:hypothetical protein